MDRGEDDYAGGGGKPGAMIFLNANRTLLSGGFELTASSRASRSSFTKCDNLCARILYAI